MIKESNTRQATHSGSWYSDSEPSLKSQLENWLSQVPSTTDKGVALPINSCNAVIVPHAGYDYSGSTAAYSYKSIPVDTIQRVFILGPNHHYTQRDCSVTSCQYYATPLGPLTIDTQMNQELLETGEFSVMDKNDDEEEHSIELQLPYLRLLFNNRIDEVKFVPILVGNLSSSNEKKFGKLLAPYLANKTNLFVISSDFCHWGNRFNYTFYSTKPEPSKYPNESLNSDLPIYQSIQNLDLEACQILELCQFQPFQDYLKSTQNTICGRHPINILLAAIEINFPLLNRSDSSESGPKIELLHYNQSSKITRKNDSSVSYVAAYLNNPEF